MKISELRVEDVVLISTGGTISYGRISGIMKAKDLFGQTVYRFTITPLAKSFESLSYEPDAEVDHLTI